MKILKAKIKKSSKHYEKGLNHKKKPVWLKILDFKTDGNENYKVQGVEKIENGRPSFVELWLDAKDLSIKKFEDGQLRLSLFEENKATP